MKILTLMGLIVLFTTSPMTNCIPGQFKPPPIPYYFPAPLTGFHTDVGSNFGFLEYRYYRQTETHEVSMNLKGDGNIRVTECPLEYSLYSTKCSRFCYQLNPDRCLSWSDAREACKTDGGDLYAADECTYPFFIEITKPTTGVCEDFWVGVFRVPPAVNHMRVNGYRVPENFKFWSSDEPDADDDDLCASMDRNDNYLLTDNECNITVGYICQIFV